MRRLLHWMRVVILCGACAAGSVGAQPPEAQKAEAQKAEAQKDFEEANKLRDAGAYSAALERAGHALALWEAVLGGSHPDVARCLDLMGDLYRRQGDLARAEPLLQRALALRRAALGEEHPDVAASLHGLANLYLNQGQYARAEPLYQRALSIREATFGKNHRDVAASLNNLAILYANQGQYERAIPLYQRALSILEAVLGDSHPSVAMAINNLANLYLNQGQYARAEPLYQRALSIREATLGKTHPDVALSLNTFAVLYMNQGQYERAEPLYQRALAIQEATLGKAHPDLAPALNNLANLYVNQGQYARAEPLYQRALAIQEAALGKAHPGVSDTLHNLAIADIRQGWYARAEPLIQRSLAIREASNHPGLASSLDSLAELSERQGAYERAESLFQRALSIRRATLGDQHPDVAMSLHNLALLYANQGQYERAEPLYQRALTLLEAALGKAHPLVAQCLEDLAQLRLAQHRLSDALPLLTRAFSLSEQRLRQEALDFSEARLSHFLQLLRQDEQELYVLLRAHPEDARVRRLALSAVLLLKGRTLEETAHISRVLSQRLGAGDREQFERLRGLRTQLATLSLSGPGTGMTPDVPQRIQQLTDEGDALEADLARRSASLRALTALPPPSEIVERVAASLPGDSALVEYIVYQDHPPAAPSGEAPPPSPGPSRYLALVLLPDASTRVVDLGAGEPIDQAATRLRDALAHRESTVQATARALYQRAFQPLLPLLGSTRRLLLSPDGQLNLVPFAALHDGHGFLLDSFDFTYLTSGRELLPSPQQDLSPASSVVVLADPDFTSGGAPSKAPAALERALGNLSGLWEPLPGTRQEAQGIQRLLPQAQLFLGPEATRQRLFHLPTPGILHLATHGFFLEGGHDPRPAGARALGSSGALGDSPEPDPREPLLRSGLVLASPRPLEPDSSTPLITALELAGLDLWGTQLVVLSACDTGRGEVHPGQGVYGLRRAFEVAGAETVVMSLWTVDDDSTRLLMDVYYRNLLAGQGRASALHEAMRSFRGSRPHPHDWAPFIALGSDAPLRSITPPAPREQTPPLPEALQTWRE